MSDEVEPEGIPAGPLSCVTCGADDVDPVLWGFGPPGEGPKLMRVLNLCETCREHATRVLRSEAERDSKRAARHLRGHLKALEGAVTNFLEGLDKLMAGAASMDRGRSIAKLANRLNLARDVARRFGLGGRG
jgi:hypothetical protein